MRKFLLVFLLSWNAHANDANSADPAGGIPDPATTPEAYTSDLAQEQGPGIVLDPAVGFGVVDSVAPLLAGKSTNRNAFVSKSGWARVGMACKSLMRRQILTVADCAPENVHVVRSRLTNRRLLMLETWSGQPYFFSLGGKRLATPDTRMRMARAFSRLNDVLYVSDGRILNVYWDKTSRQTKWYFGGQLRRYAKTDYLDLNYFVTPTSNVATCAEGIEDWYWPGL